MPDSTSCKRPFTLSLNRHCCRHSRISYRWNTRTSSPATGSSASVSNASFQSMVSMAIIAPIMMKIWVNMPANTSSINWRMVPVSSTTRFISSPASRPSINESDSALILANTRIRRSRLMRVPSLLLHRVRVMDRVMDSTSMTSINPKKVNTCEALPSAGTSTSSTK